MMPPEQMAPSGYARDEFERWIFEYNCDQTFDEWLLDRKAEPLGKVAKGFEQERARIKKDAIELERERLSDWFGVDVGRMLVLPPSHTGFMKASPYLQCDNCGIIPLGRSAGQYCLDCIVGIYQLHPPKPPPPPAPPPKRAPPPSSNDKVTWS